MLYIPAIRRLINLNGKYAELTADTVGNYFILAGVKVYIFDTAIIPNTTTTAAKIGSFAFSNLAVGKIYYSDGTKWQLLFPSTVAAPSTATSAGTVGEIRFDASYIYICIADNIWKRVAVATW